MGGDHQRDGGDRLIIKGGVLYGADLAVAEWVGQQIEGYVMTPGATALGVIRQGRLVAGVVYERFNGFHVEASIAAAHGASWADRSTLFKLFHYPFHQLGADAITVTVPGSNLPSLNLALKLGFEPQAYVAFAAPDGSPLIVLQQFRNTCRWVNRDGQRQERTGTGGP